MQLKIKKLRMLRAKSSMVLGGRGQGICDDNSNCSVILQKSVTMGKGVKNCPQLCDGIFGRPLYGKIVSPQVTTVEKS